LPSGALPEVPAAGRHSDKHCRSDDRISGSRLDNAKLMRQLGRVDLLILDDWGPEPLLPEQQRDRRYELVGNPTLADAILDRIIPNADRVESTLAELGIGCGSVRQTDAEAID